MVKCVAPGCKSGYATAPKEPGVSFHKCPDEKNKLQRWKNAIPRAN